MFPGRHRPEALNKLLESALARRAASLREIGNLKDVLASRLRSASDDAILDGEFTEHDPGPSAAAGTTAVARTADKPAPKPAGTRPRNQPMIRCAARSHEHVAADRGEPR